MTGIDPAEFSREVAGTHLQPGGQARGAGRGVLQFESFFAGEDVHCGSEVGIDRPAHDEFGLLEGEPTPGRVVVAAEEAAELVVGGGRAAGDRHDVDADVDQAQLRPAQRGERCGGGRWCGGFGRAQGGQGGDEGGGGPQSGRRGDTEKHGDPDRKWVCAARRMPATKARYRVRTGAAGRELEGSSGRHGR